MFLGVKGFRGEVLGFPQCERPSFKYECGDLISHGVHRSSESGDLLDCGSDGRWNPSWCGKVVPLR